MDPRGSVDGRSDTYNESEMFSKKNAEALGTKDELVQMENLRNKNR